MAEVLITLGIIGVVAAMTLPALQQKMENRSLRTAFQKSYRNILTVLNEIQADKGIPYECGNKNGAYTTTECKEFWADFFARYKIIKRCGYRETGCAVVYKKKAEVLAQGGNINNGSCSFLDNATSTSSIAYIAIDGSIIYTTTNQGGIYFAVDVNGVKGPNRWGYDMFYMTLDTSKGAVHINDSVCAMWENGGKRVRNILLDTTDVEQGWAG